MIPTEYIIWIDASITTVWDIKRQIASIVIDIGSNEMWALVNVIAITLYHYVNKKKNQPKDKFLQNRFLHHICR